MKLSDSDRTILRMFFRTNSEWLSQNIENKEEIKQRFTKFVNDHGQGKHMCKAFEKTINGRLPKYARRFTGKVPSHSKLQFFDYKLRSLFSPVFETTDPGLSFWEKQSRMPCFGGQSQLEELTQSIARKVESMRKDV